MSGSDLTCSLAIDRCALWSSDRNRGCPRAPGHLSTPARSRLKADTDRSPRRLASNGGTTRTSIILPPEGLEERLESMARMTGAAVEAAERLPGLIDNAESAASMAGSEAEDSKRSVEDLTRDVDLLRSELLTPSGPVTDRGRPTTAIRTAASMGSVLH